MGSFFKIFFACLLALVLAGFLFVLVLFGVAASFGREDKPDVNQEIVLHIDLGTFVAEQAKEEDLDPSTFSIESMLGLQDLIEAVYHARGDSMVKAIYLTCSGNAYGLAAGQELGAALDSFQSGGKPLVAFADALSQDAYAIAHKASHLYVQPGGIVEWKGLFVEVLFFKNLLDRLAIKPEVFYAGQFKSATEPFRTTKMSDANRTQYQAFINEVYRQDIVSIGKKRSIDSVRLTTLANTLSVRTAEQAFGHGMIDGLLYHDQVKDTLKALIGLSKKDNINFMTIENYSEATKSDGSGDRIAVVYAVGSIVDGKGNDTEIGGDTYRKLIANIRTDDKVKAVVLRINSPGGSAIASEMIWRELQMLQKKKPLVVSMGDYAASGGYYIACAADTIFAMPNTLTGSIGVFTLLFDAQKLFNDKLGINFDGVKTSPYADFGNFTRPMSDFERQVAQRDVDSIYETFKSRVVEGRKLSGAYVDSIAQGRVWSGTDGLSVGLVDRIGSFKDAVSCAARMASLKKYSMREYPKRQTIFDKLFYPEKDAETKTMNLLVKKLPPHYAGWFNEYFTLSRMANIPQARVPFVIQQP